MTLLNCTAFSNGSNYGMSGPIDPGSVMTLKNCISAGTGSISILSTAVQATNSWMSPFVVTNADFVSVDTAGVRGARNPDGSLPALTFMHLAAGSDLIDAGTHVGLPYLGSAPDLGAYEYDPSSDVTEIAAAPRRFVLSQNYPNPFNPTTKIRFSVGQTGRTSLTVYNLLGQRVATLFDEIAVAGQDYTIRWEGSQLVSGLYFYRLQSGNRNDVKRMLLLK